MSDLELAIYQVDITPDTDAPVRSIEFSSKTTVIIRFCHVGTVCVCVAMSDLTAHTLIPILISAIVGAVTSRQLFRQFMYKSRLLKHTCKLSV